MTTANPNIPVLDDAQERIKGDSLWADSFRRLRRNRMAVLGIIIILINIIAAVFAPIVAPHDPFQQTLENNNAAPQWVIDLFPSMRSRDENITIGRGWNALVQTGDTVETGQILMVRDKDGEVEYTIENGTATDNATGEEISVRRANMNGTVFVNAGSVVIGAKEAAQFPLTEGLTPAVENEQAIEAGDVLAARDDSVNSIEAPFAGTAYVTEEAIVLQQDNSRGYVKVSSEYPLGADSLGRDLLSRLIYGARISLMVAFVGPLVSLIVGVIIGLVAGFFGGWVDTLIMRIVDVVYAFPSLLFIILLMAFFRGSVNEDAITPGTFAYFMSEIDRGMGGMFFIFIGIGLTSWTGLARLTRGQVLSVRENEYITAARSLGTSNWKIMTQHVLPNILGPIIVSETLTIPTYIRYEAFLSFIGLGVNPPTPSWGMMISEGTNSLVAYPFQTLFPAIALFLIMFAFNFLGDGLRDALDPRMRGVD